MAPGRMRLELVRIRREIRRVAESRHHADAILDQASRDHQRVMRELATIKNKLVRQELLELGMKVQEEGRLTRAGSQAGGVPRVSRNNGDHR